jgi:protein ImuA
MSALPKNIEDIHPALWRASQLARAHSRTVDTGYAALSAEMPGGGWPLGTLVELLVQQPGIGEVRLLRPALTAVSKRPIALLQSSCVPNAVGFAYLGIPPGKLLRLQAPKTADALWSAEQILKTGSCGALIFWQQHIRTECLRRLLLAAQSSETLFVVVRPLATAADASPASLRLSVRPAEGGVLIEFIKRKGPVRGDPLVVDVTPSSILLSPHGRPRRQQSPNPTVVPDLYIGAQ